MTIAKLVCPWTNIPGGTGYSVFYLNNQSPSPAPFITFFTAVGPFLPVGVRIDIPNNGQLLDEATGKMVNVWTQGTAGSVTGTGSTTFFPASGGQVKWGTGTYANGRHVMGRTFLVPLGVSSLAAGGGLATSTANTINSAATTLIQQTSSSLVTWHRPKYKKADTPGDPPVLVAQGSIATVVNSTVPLKTAVLTGRRDT